MQLMSTGEKIGWAFAVAIFLAAMSAIVVSAAINGETIFHSGQRTSQPTAVSETGFSWPAADGYADPPDANIHTRQEEPHHNCYPHHQ